MWNLIKIFFYSSWYWFDKIFDSLIPVGDLFIRIWIAQIFLLSGLTKIQSWSTTLILFEHEYHVPLLSSYWAAVIGTASEIVLPIFILLGLGGRIPALGLFIFNIVAVVSYPFLFTEAGSAGLEDHFYWGILLMIIMFHGPGKISLDYFLKYLWSKSNKEI